ncbi:MAG: NAD(P)H-dependent oxidoreductase [Pseudomonadota bacterium]
MAQILIINGHHPYPFAEGRLNASFAERAKTWFESQGDAVKLTKTSGLDWDADAEIADHQWADTILLQFPVNWMGLPWSLKKYMDEVYTAGMDGRLCAGDGRSREDASKHYGSGGSLTGKRYMLSVTFNAPREAFDDPDQFLFQGRSLDDLLFPQHMNFRFFGMKALPSFAAYDVMKTPEIEADFARFDAHLASAFQKSGHEAA